jgi:hypothetical protein
MTYYGRQRMESFKRAMFAAQLSDRPMIARPANAMDSESGKTVFFCSRDYLPARARLNRNLPG